VGEGAGDVLAGGDAERRRAVIGPHVDRDRAGDQGGVVAQVGGGVAGELGDAHPAGVDAHRAGAAALAGVGGGPGGAVDLELELVGVGQLAAVQVQRLDDRHCPRRRDDGVPEDAVDVGDRVVVEGDRVAAADHQGPGVDHRADDRGGVVGQVGV